MKRYLAALGMMITAAGGLAQSAPPGSGALAGPGKATLGDVSELMVARGFSFLDGDQTRAMLRRAGDPVSGQELGFLRPDTGGWAVYFEFDDIGYIKDAEKEKLDADKLLDSFKQGTAAANEDRVAAGFPPIEIIGWDKEPVYDAATQNLEWCLRARSDGQEFVNYNTRLLGRKGVMEVVLVVDPKDLNKVMPEFREVIAQHQFQTGQSYAEYKPGDKIAKYGLGALILGGAAVGAAKLGLLGSVLLFFKKAWKLFIIGLVAFAGAAKSLLSKIFGGRSSTG